MFRFTPPTPSLVAFLLSACGVASAADPWEFVTVRAKVTQVCEKRKDGDTPATLEVTRVYRGPADLKGATFEDVYQKLGDARGGGPRTARVPFEVGEEGVWVLSRKRAADGEAPPAWRVSSRSRQKFDRGFAATEAVAEAAERVDAAKPGERLGLLLESAAANKYEVGIWALREVGKLGTADAAEYLKKMAVEPDAKLPALAQVGLDEVLCQREDVDWRGSQPRAALLRRWVRNAHAEGVVGWVLSRIDSAHQSEQLGDKLAVELLTTAAGNKEWSKKSRESAMEQLWRTTKHTANEDAHTAAWEAVFDHAKSNDDLELRRFAAEVAALFPLYAARVKVIEEHLATEKDEKVAESLRAAVKKAKAEK